MRGEPSERCAYCGDPATEVDHVVPRVFRRMMESVDAKYNRDLPDTVPSCRECNAIAGGKVFGTFVEKRECIRARLRVKYANDLVAPSWRMSELEELGPSMRTYIEGAALRQERARRRVSWRGGIVEHLSEPKDRDEKSHVCAVCDEIFYSNARGARYCSQGCANVVQRAKAAQKVAQQPERICAHCGHSYVGLGVKFCSTRCAALSRYAPT